MATHSPQTYLSIASGVGGLDLAVTSGSSGTAHPVCYIENEITAAAVLAARMEDGTLAEAPIWSDLKTFDYGSWSGLVDGIIAGFPCQPYSISGNRSGEHHSEYVWPSLRDGIRAANPAWVFLENVSGILGVGGYEVFRDLQELGYDVSATLLSAEEVGASHRRVRLFILANSHSKREASDGQIWGSTVTYEPSNTLLEQLGRGPGEYDGDLLTQSEFRGGHYGTADGLDLTPKDRTHLLGNSVVPLQAAVAWRLLWHNYASYRK